MKTVTAILLVTTALALGEEECMKNGKRGVCKLFIECKPALDEFKKYKTNPQMCIPVNNVPKVCCVERVKYTGSLLTPGNHGGGGAEPSCAPVARNLTAEKTGQKAWDKCIEYQEKLVYPCRDSNTPSGGTVRLDLCSRKPDSLIIGGVEAYEGEFPHMVLLGFANATSDQHWACGGVLVSERYIMTAGHCTYSRVFGPVTDAKVGILARSQPADASRRYKIKRIIKHPDYRSPHKYNDIALLETDRDIALDHQVVPACLHNGHQVNDSSALVTGWGTTVARAQNESNVLQKVTLQKFSDEECAREYSPNSPGMRLMRQGYNSTTQMCFGDWHKVIDSCNGDSGGPVQVKHPGVYCMYAVVGVTSWGRRCGHPGHPAIYTRVRAFVPWIESVVWP